MKKRIIKILRGFFVYGFIFLVFILLLGAGFVFGVIKNYSKDLPDVNKLKDFKPAETTKIYASDGTLIGTVFKENRTYINLSDVSQNFINAIIAIEDDKFYSHMGISVKGMIRAAWANYRGESVKQGASTITQQLARSIFLTPEVSIKRKIREALLSIAIEKKFTKDEILELYVNQIYFGAGAYGIEEAAKTYFHKDAKDLDVAESAILAGLPQAPSEYSPDVNFEKAKQRQILVLNRMLELNYISNAEYKNSKDEVMTIYKPKSELQNLEYPYFTTYVLKELYEKYPSNLVLQGGLKVYTTLDIKTQKIAEKAIIDGVKRNAPNYNANQSALVAIEPKTGYIKAMVGGTGYTEGNQFNRAWQARRQPGSAFKIFVYTAAVDMGYPPTYILYDSPITYTFGTETWSPVNADNKYWGAMTMATAIQYSRNVCAVRMADQIGMNRVIEYAHRMGIKDEIEPYLSSSLGAGVLTILDMTAAVSVLANEGIKCEPTTIKLILDSRGNTIEDHRVPYKEEILPVSTVEAMVKMLEAVISGGTATTAQIGRPAAGKTGTTSDFRDAWFVGFTPDLACAVWCGNDDYSRLWNGYGGEVAAPIWGDFMKKALKGIPPKEFTFTQRPFIQLRICKDSGLRATTKCPKTEIKSCKTADAPKKYCNLHPDTATQTTKKSENYAPKDKDKDKDKNKDKDKDTQGDPQGVPDFNTGGDAPPDIIEGHTPTDTTKNVEPIEQTPPDEVIIQQPTSVPDNPQPPQTPPTQEQVPPEPQGGNEEF